MSAGHKTVGIVGARGHVGAELMRMIERHPRLRVAFAGARDLDPEGVASRGADAVVLALPNGASEPWVRAIRAASDRAVILDLSADHRFDDAWVYGMPELDKREALRSATSIAVPGCYATAMALVIAPVAHLLAAPAQCFGVSGYSGAGTTPSDKNNPELLRDNLMPYSLVGHVHEREVRRHTGAMLNFFPHVAPHFRGITMTVSLTLQGPVSSDDLRALYEARYRGEPLVRIEREAPWVSRVAGKDHIVIGGFSAVIEESRAVVVAALDNLRKGAATQALQGLNLALGLDELMGIGDA